MKNKGMIWVGVVVGLIVYSCDKDNGAGWGPEGPPRYLSCLHFVDGITGGDLDAVKIRYTQSSLVYYGLSITPLYTDVTGTICFGFNEGDNPTVLECSKPGYVSLFQDIKLENEDTTITVKMFHQ